MTPTGNPLRCVRATGAIVYTADQHRDTFAVSCYHKILRAQRDIEAKMRTERKDAKDIQASVQAARDSGKLPRPPQGTMMYMRSGKTEAEAKVLWVMLMAGTTPESTGLPTERGQGSPWLMRAGTPRAHVMNVPDGFDVEVDFPPSFSFHIERHDGPGHHLLASTIAQR
jgi:hypothetical protein